ncbi:MAG: hypothetical protein LBL58_08875 [Tannerellaceae bacterium]|jgi:hypothetical protein|nr:hypothetical protein [Tannerellaceae bacterium]
MIDQEQRVIEKISAQKVIGIQIGAESFIDEGVEQVLDTLQEKGAVNTLYVSTFTYDRGIHGRPGRNFPDHGIPEPDTDRYHGGNYATPHAGFYKNTRIKGEWLKAPDFGDVDILEKVIPAARRRRMKVYASVQDGFNYPEDVTAFREFYEENLGGQKGGAMCFYAPDVREFWKAVCVDLCTSYDIDGILLFNERGGPFLNALGASHNQSVQSSRVTCFCEHHRKAAEANGIDFERAKEGYRKLDAFVQASLSGNRPVDGYYVAFERLMFACPEIYAWNQLFDWGKSQILADVYEAVKSVKKNQQVGFHIEHVNSFNPFYRATRGYGDMAKIADFLKVVVYNNCGGERYAGFVRNAGSIIFRDVPHEELMHFNNYLLGYSEKEASMDELAMAGLSPDYVYRETRRALEGVRGQRCDILPGIDINIPTGRNSRVQSPEDAYEATLAALKAGAQGVILSRKYSEMTLANLEAVGRATRNVGSLKVETSGNRFHFY